MPGSQVSGIDYYRLGTLTQVFDLLVCRHIFPCSVNIGAGVQWCLGPVLVCSPIHHKSIRCGGQFLFDDHIVS